MVRTQTKIKLDRSGHATLKPGEIVSSGNRIMWCNVYNKMLDFVPFLMYTLTPIDDVIDLASRVGGISTVQLYAQTRMMRYAKNVSLVKLVEGVNQDLEVYEMRLPWWRRLLSMFKPITVYGYRWSPASGRLEKVVIELRGLRLKPKIAEKHVYSIKNV